MSLFSPRVNCRALYVQAVIFQDMPTFSAVPVRGYTLHSTGDNLAMLRDHPGIRAGTLTAQSLSEYAPSIVQLDSYGTPIQVDGGWDSPRCSVLIELKADMANNEEKLFRLRGYTNNIDFSYTNEPSPDLAVFINNIEEIKLSHRLQGSVVATTNQVMCTSTQANKDVYIVRPEDVIIGCGAADSLANEVSHDEIETAINATTYNRLSETPFSVNLPVTTAPTWLATILNSYLDGIAMTEQSTTGITNPLTYAMNAHPTNGIYSNPFIQILAQQMNGYGGAWGWLRYHALLQLDPTLQGDRARVRRYTTANISTETARFDIYGSEPTIAQSVATSIRTWMYQANIATVSLQMTNLTLTGQPEVRFTDKVGPLSILPDPIRDALLDTFVRNITTLLMPQITQNGTVECSVLVSASHSGATTVVVTLGGGGAIQSPPQRYTFPAFMDNTFSPMLSRRSPSDTGKTAGQFLLAANMLRDSIMPTSLMPSMQTVSNPIPHPTYSNQPVSGHPMYDDQSSPYKTTYTTTPTHPSTTGGFSI